MPFPSIAATLKELSTAQETTNLNSPISLDTPLIVRDGKLNTSPLVAQGFLNSYRQGMIESDRFYREGNLQAAKQIQRTLKPDFSGSGTAVAQPITDVNSPNLSGAAAVYWRNAQEGIAQNLESKIFEPLQRLTENYPDFIPGHLAFAKACEANPIGCERSADGNQPTNAIDVIDRASALFPDYSELVDAHLQILIREAERTEKPAPLLEASILARQYALNYPDRPESRGYQQVAQQLEEEYRSQLRDLVFSQYVFQSLFGQDQQALQLMIAGESAFGEYQKEQYLASQPLLKNANVQAYVQRVGQSLAQWAGRSDFEYEFFVLDDLSPNAAALPGGKIFVTVGLLNLLQTEAELAGVLSHEIAHTTLSHGYIEFIEDQVTRDVTMNILGRKWGGVLGAYAVQLRSRKHERSADILGTRLLARSNYSADGLYIAMQRFAALEGNRQTASWLDSHPAGRERVEYLEDIIVRNNYNRYAYEGIADYVTMQASLGVSPATVIAESQNEGSPATAVHSPGNPGTATLPQTAPRSTAPASEPIIGLIPLSIIQERTGVRLEIQTADVSARGTYSLNFTVSNNTNQPFIFVIPFSQIVNTVGEQVSAKFECERSSTLEPGDTLNCQCRVIGQPWQAGDRQDLILVLKEGTPEARVFRVSF